MSAPLRVKISVDGKPVERGLAALIALWERLPEVRNSVLNLLDPFVLLDTHSETAPGTGDLRVFLKPSKRLLEVLAAGGAGEGDIDVIKRAFGHGEVSSDKAGSLA